MLDKFGWLFSFSLGITIIFGIIVVILSMCWWKIFKLTIRHFNLEDKNHD
ncbi:hypothetical protein LFAB_16450 [Companilactobacillus farciminis]|jgi:hypothetical protein|nr:hypothetical protein LFAB_16450 [Companilactobacillus farciminis]